MIYIFNVPGGQGLVDILDCGMNVIYATLFQDAGESDGIVQVKHVSNEVNIINIYIKPSRINHLVLMPLWVAIYEEGRSFVLIILFTPEVMMHCTTSVGSFFRMDRSSVLKNNA